ncbi:hypothetical protein BD414DRAFT_307741 [Trametes punicea]|nr:hypothetical protein BD414DRAFT_307741 [Trametes punicea]
MSEISLRHIPDLSDASAIADFSDASFQIPPAVGNADDLLLADDSLDFFNGANDTLSTPAPSSRPVAQPPLTLAEVTPRSQPARTAAARSSLRPRPGIATPYKAVVTKELATALSDDLSPFRQQDPSFQIPPPRTGGEGFLIADGSADFLGQEEPSLDASPPRASNPLTLSQLTTGPLVGIGLTSSASPSSPCSQAPYIEATSTAREQQTSIEKSESHPTVIPSTAACLVATSPRALETAHVMHSDQCIAGRPVDEEEIKEPKKGPLSKNSRKLPGGEKAKRKRVTSTAPITKPAKLKPLAASLARRVLNTGRKPLPGMRGRSLLNGPASHSSGDASSRCGNGAAQASSSSVQTNVRSTVGGGLADTLLSFGQKMLANAASSKQSQKGGAESGGAFVPVPEADGPAPPVDDGPSDSTPFNHQAEQAIPGANDLIPSQLSPRIFGSDGPTTTATLRSWSSTTAETPTEGFAQPDVELRVSELARPPSPIRSSIKRAGSPTHEQAAHQRKRSKTTSGSSAPTSKDGAPRRPALQPSRARNTPADASTAGAVHARRVVSASASSANPREKANETRKPETLGSRSLSRSGSDLEASKASKVVVPGQGQTHAEHSAIVSTASSRGRSGNARYPQRENVPDTQEHHLPEHRDEQASIRQMSSTDRPPSSSSSARPTRPVEFEFQFTASSRIESRRVVLERSGSSSGANNGMSLKRSKAHAVHPIPDFKALHAMQESLLAQRKAEIVPVVPQPIEFQTEARAHEREKFEEARRAREAELERQREERRRQQELEEEREIKELRRRAVPKANEIPEWYAFAPKKSKAGTGK